MGTLINYLITVYKTYTSFGDLYIKLFSLHLTFFDFSIAFVWLVILACLFINYFIKEYGLKFVIVWVFKRLIFAIFVGYSFYFFSNFTYCDTDLNRSIHSNFFSKQAVNYVIIKTLVVSSFVVLYKYGSWLYTDVNRYTCYKNFLEKKNIYDVDYKTYISYFSYKHNINLNQFAFLSDLYQNFNKAYSNLILYFSKSYLNIGNDLFKLTGYKIDIANEFLSTFKNTLEIKSSAYSNNINLLIKFYKNNVKIIKNLQFSNKKYIIDKNYYDSLIADQIEYEKKITSLINFYNTTVIPFCLKRKKNIEIMEFYWIMKTKNDLTGPLMNDDLFFQLKMEFDNNLLEKDLSLKLKKEILILERMKIEFTCSASIKQNVIQEENMIRQTQQIIYDLDCLFDDIFNLSEKIFYKIDNIKFLPILDLVNVKDFNLVVVPKVSKPLKSFEFINYPLDSLEGLKFFSINVGYACFYPILYCSNKIFGTVNPLSSKLFNESISYLIHLITNF